MRTKLSSLFADLSQGAQTPDLEPARISQHGALPSDEFVQPAACLDRFDSRSQPKVIGVPQNDPRVEFRRLQFFKTNSLHRPRSSDGHEHRRFDYPTTGREQTGTRFAFTRNNIEVERLSFHTSNNRRGHRGTRRGTQNSFLCALWGNLCGLRGQSYPSLKTPNGVASTYAARQT